MTFSVHGDAEPVNSAIQRKTMARQIFENAEYLGDSIVIVYERGTRDTIASAREIRAISNDDFYNNRRLLFYYSSFIIKWCVIANTNTSRL